MSEATSEAPNAICPSCSGPLTEDDGVMCGSCEAEASAGGEDAKTQQQAKREDTQQKARKPPVKAEPKQGELKAQAPANGAQQKPPPAQAQPAATGKKMSVANVRDLPEEQPYRLALYGVPSVGKSTFGADAPSPIFLPVETSTNIRAPKLPQPENWREIVEAVEALTVEQHQYKTLVFDTVDRAEPLCWAQVIENDNERLAQGQRRSRTIEDVGGGYMKGYVAAVQKWTSLLARVERLQKARGMSVIFISHAAVKTFKNPEAGDYDRWEMKVHPKLAALVGEWCEAVLFANFKTVVKTDKRGRSLRKGESAPDGGRSLFTQRTPGYDAKNRYGLPASLPLDFAEFHRAVMANRDPAAVVTFIMEKVKLLGDPQIAAWTEAQLAQKPSLSMLTRINNRLAVRLEEKVAREESEEAGGVE